MSEKTRKLILLLAIACNFAISIGYSNFESFDPMVKWSAAYADTDLYIGEYYGTRSHKFAVHRLVTPYLARLSPGIPASFFGPGRAFNQTSIVAFKFAIINVVFLVATSIVLYYLNRGFGLSETLAAFGALLFFCLPMVIRQGALPIVDTSYWFFLSLAVLAVQRQNIWLLVGATLIGVFAKEQVLWVILFILLAPFTKTRRFVLLCAVGPAFVAYSMVVFGSGLSVDNYYLWGSSLPLILKAVNRLFSINGLFQLWMSFGFLWLYCVYALIRCRPPTILQRWAWFIPAVLFATRLLGVSGVMRHMTITFVVVIPLALIGISKWLSLGEPINCVKNERGSEIS